MAKDKVKSTPLEDGLIVAMRALDNQVAREMQREPTELDTHGVMKWEPYQKRIEKVCSLVLDSLGEGTVELDSLLILSEAYAKALRLIIDDLGEKGLGRARTAYCLKAVENIATDARLGKQVLQGDREMHS